MCATTNDPVVVNDEFTRGPERNNLVAHANAKSRKIFPGTIGPLEINSLESRPFTREANIASEISHFASQSPVDAVPRDNDASLEIQVFTEGSLPKAYGLGISNRRKAIKEYDLWLLHGSILVRSEN